MAIKYGEIPYIFYKSLTPKIISSFKSLYLLKAVISVSEKGNVTITPSHSGKISSTSIGNGKNCAQKFYSFNIILS